METMEELTKKQVLREQRSTIGLLVLIALLAITPLEAFTQNINMPVSALNGIDVQNTDPSEMPKGEPDKADSFYKECGLDKETDYLLTHASELDSLAKGIGLNYTLPEGYTASCPFSLRYSEANPVALQRTTFAIKESKWIHEDDECVLFIQCSPTPVRDSDKLVDEIPENVFAWIRNSLMIGSMFKKTTDKQMEELNKILTYWSPEESKEVFNAQHVITYPIDDPESAYQDKYRHRLSLIVVKWGKSLRVSFLLTNKGYENREMYIEDVKNAFWFED